ncbi:hypothetical protein MN116_007513 [Schistosoma mekongi]|uniref:CXXC-type zinc finger protein 1 n=1 Tax=Schistosoma mekongi TaxID=38744 RepID=A0AAE1Z8T7_SCHME|nr:hypothetical protein MN116_007513 [Schistosoma mekongi]
MQKRRKNSNKKKIVSEEFDVKISEVYCVCRSSDAERFMIACDQCEEWYHGDCINVTPKQAEQIKTFYCPQCRCKNPSLEIEYKNTRNQKPKQNRMSTSPNNDSSTSPDQLSVGRQIKGKRRPSDASVSNLDTGPRCAPGDRSLHSPFRSIRKFNPSGRNVFPSSPTSDPTALAVYNRVYWEREDHSELRDHELVSATPIPKKRSGSPRLRPCGNCTGCSIQEDCGKCEYCRDRRKFGGPNKMRQKCRLRQCTGINASRTRNPSNSSQGVGSRRRKQPPIEATPVDTSPSHIQSYADFDDEQFEVPLDFSPRPYSDNITQSFLSHHSSSSAPLSSKMRRGDHRIPATSEIDGITHRLFGRLGHDCSQPHSRSKASVPNIYPISADEHMDFADNDSDDDIVLPEMAHCAGPACMLAAIPGEKYCSESCKLKHTNSRCSIRSGIPNLRPGITTITSREANPIPYCLPYPDHMYCRHHRVQNWNNNVFPSYRIGNQPFDQFTIDQAYITADGLLQTRGHPTFRCSPGPVHRITPQRLPNSHPVLINSNNRLNSVDTQGNAMICDAADTATFMDSMTSAVRRSNNHGTINAFNEDLGIDLPSTYPSTGTHLSSPSLSGIYSCYAGSNRDDNIRPVDLHTIDGDGSGLPPDVDDDEADVSQIVSEVGSHPVYGYYMISYGNETNGHNSRVPMTNASTPTSNKHRIGSGSLHTRMNIRHPNHKIITQSNGESANGIPGPYTRNRTLPVGGVNFRHTNLTVIPGTVSHDNCLSPSGSTDVNDIGVGNVGSSGSNSNVTPHTVSSYIPGPDEFYTINDSDDLEINWPQETVAGVNG